MSLYDNTYLLLGLLILSFTITPLLRKFVIHEFTDEEFFVYNNIFAFLVVMMFSIYFFRAGKCNFSNITQKVTPRNAVICALGAITGIAGGILLMALLKRNDASFVIPQVQPVVILLTMLIAYFMATEDINRFKILGTMLIIMGLVAINYGKVNETKK